MIKTCIFSILMHVFQNTRGWCIFKIACYQNHAPNPYYFENMPTFSLLMHVFQNAFGAFSKIGKDLLVHDFENTR